MELSLCPHHQMELLLNDTSRSHHAAFMSHTSGFSTDLILNVFLMKPSYDFSLKRCGPASVAHYLKEKVWIPLLFEGELLRLSSYPLVGFLFSSCIALFFKKTFFLVILPHQTADPQGCIVSHTNCSEFGKNACFLLSRSKPN